jgi:hypothetical protein
MNTRAKTFGSPSGEPSTTRPMLQQMCEKLWTLPSLAFVLNCRYGLPAAGGPARPAYLRQALRRQPLWHRAFGLP